MEGDEGTIESLSTSRMDDDDHSLLTADVDEGKGVGIDQLEKDEEDEPRYVRNTTPASSLFHFPFLSCSIYIYLYFFYIVGCMYVSLYVYARCLVGVF